LKRNTSQRAAIQQVFLQHDQQPMSVDEILAHGRHVVPSLNQATVYRNVKILLNDGWLKQVDHPSLGFLYERSGKGHHHHFLCRVCNRVFDVPGCALNLKKAVPPGFVVENHDVFFFGLCPSCCEKT
jgi:Fur family ferric uptake transcriptional regulator